MNVKNSSVSLRSVRLLTQEFNIKDEYDDSVTDRQERVPGFRQEKARGINIVMIGAGGLGGEISHGLARKGYCENAVLSIFDGDVVTASCLSRQRFYPEQLYQNKAVSLGKNLMREAIKRSTICAYPMTIQEAVENSLDIKGDLFICAPDNDKTRTFVAKEIGLKKLKPVIFCGVSRDADWGFVFVQELGGACFGCLSPNAVKSQIQPCPKTPAVIDILKVLAGICLFAVDTVIMDRKRNWNYKSVSLSSFMGDTARTIERRPDCPLCGKGNGL